MKAIEISIENLEAAIWFASNETIYKLMKKYGIEKYEGIETARILAECIYVNLPTNNVDYSEQLDFVRKEMRSL